MVDVALLAIMYVELGKQGRRELARLEAGDFFNLGFTVWVALVRVGFLMGVGGGEAATGKGRKGR